MTRQRQQRRRPMFYGGPDPITLHKMQEILRGGRDLLNQRNAMYQQLNNRNSSNDNGPVVNYADPPYPRSMPGRDLPHAELDPRRNMAVDCGWPTNISPEDYKHLIDRDPLAGFVNSVYPLEAAQVEPVIFEDDDEKITTGFERTLAELPETIRREPSYHDSEDGSILNQVFLNLDLLSGYSRYGALLIGLDDGKDLSEPAGPKKGQRCTFLRSFPEHLCRITGFDSERNSPRWGYPTQYQITFADPQDMSATGVNESSFSQQVHWSRIVHVCDFWHHQSSSPFFAIERLRPVLNPILDARKIRGSSAEGYYQTCFSALHFGTHPSLGPDVDIDRDSILDMYEQFANGLQRIFITSGLTVDDVERHLPDANPHLMIQYMIILMKMRIPMRIAMGSEEGKLASGDDKKKWVKRLSSRHRYHNTPHLMVPVLDRLINLGCLERPKKKYQIYWPEIDLDTAAERMDALFKRAQAWGQYASNDVERFVPPVAFASKFDNFSVSEAMQMIEEADEHYDEVKEDRLEELAAETVITTPPPVVAASTSRRDKSIATSKKSKKPLPKSKIPKQKKVVTNTKELTEEELTAMYGKKGKQVNAKMNDSGKYDLS